MILVTTKVFNCHAVQCVMTRAILFHQQKEQSHQYNGGAETGAGWGLHRRAGAGVNTLHLFAPTPLSRLCCCVREDLETVFA